MSNSWSEERKQGFPFSRLSFQFLLFFYRSTTFLSPGPLSLSLSNSFLSPSLVHLLQKWEAPSSRLIPSLFRRNLFPVTSICVPSSASCPVVSLSRVHSTVRFLFFFFQPSVFHSLFLSLFFLSLFSLSLSLSGFLPFYFWTDDDFCPVLFRKNSILSFLDSNGNKGCKKREKSMIE